MWRCPALLQHASRASRHASLCAERDLGASMLAHGSVKVTSGTLIYQWLIIISSIWDTRAASKAVLCTVGFCRKGVTFLLNKDAEIKAVGLPLHDTLDDFT